MTRLLSEKRLDEIKERNYNDIAEDVQFLLGELEIWKLVAGDRFTSWEKSQEENKQLRRGLESIVHSFVQLDIDDAVQIAIEALEETK